MDRKKLVRNAAFGVAGIAVLGAAGAFGWHWWTVSRFFESTDDAYLQADYTTIAPKVSGYVAAVLVADNQKVAAGEVLARIDDRDFKVALEQATARVGVAQDAIRSLDAQIALQRSLIAQARADIDAARAAHDFAQSDYRRYRDLARTNYVAKQRLQQAEARLRERTAGLAHDRAALVAAERRREVLGTKRMQAASQLHEAQAAEHQARLNLSYTTITAPLAGTIGDRKLRVGQYVQAGTPLMAVVPLEQVYVVANFKETQLTHVHAGQPVSIAVDTFPGVSIQGRVESLSPASGLEFALLPPDNATGNFTKIVQRIPVKIALDPRNPLLGLLRPGMSVEPSIDTRPGALAASSIPADTAPGAAPSLSTGPLAANDVPHRD